MLEETKKPAHNFAESAKSAFSNIKNAAAHLGSRFASSFTPEFASANETPLNQRSERIAPTLNTFNSFKTPAPSFSNEAMESAATSDAAFTNNAAFESVDENEPQTFKSPLQPLFHWAGSFAAKTAGALAPTPAAPPPVSDLKISLPDDDKVSISLDEPPPILKPIASALELEETFTPPTPDEITLGIGPTSISQKAVKKTPPLYLFKEQRETTTENAETTASPFVILEEFKSVPTNPTPPAAEAYIDRIKSNPQWGYTIHGIFDDNLKADFSYRNTFCIGKLRDVEKFLQNTSMDEVAIALSLKEYYKLGDMVAVCEKSGVHTKFVPDYYKFISTNPVTEDLNGLPVINIRNVPLTNTVNKCIKRLVDIIGSIVCIILFSPIMAVVAVLVKKSSPGPIIFCQERVGLHNKPFKMYKFRSMGVQSASKEQKAWTVHNDPRVTPVGRIIRKTSLDELPQLFNVLKGDMSLIGPRPERPLFVEKFKEEIPRYMIKHQVRPGMTGWAQVCGFRGDTSIEGRIEHDIFYIENWTLSFDIKILFLTVFKGFVNKNAY